MSISASMEPSAFSEDGKYYSQIGSDGRCKIWDTETNILKQEFIPDLHLSAPLSCLYWIQLDGGTLNPKWKSRKRKSSIPEDENERQITHCIAFGSTSGKVLIYSLTHAKVESVLEDANTTQGEQDICCMDWSKKNGLFTCSLDSTIRQWSIEDGLVKINFKMSKFEKGTRNSKTTAIKVPQSPTTVGRRLLLTASGQLRLWCLDSRTVLRTMVGHAGDVCHLDIVSFTKDGRYLDIISGSKTDRILSLWKVTLESDELEAVADDMPESRKAKRRSRTKSGGGDTPTTETRPSCNFLMEDMARQVSCRAEGGRSEVKLCAVTRRGVVHYYEHILNGMSSKPIKPSTTIQVVSEEKNQVKLAAAVCGTLRGDSLLVGYSSGTGIKFEKITPDTSEKTQVLIRTLKEKETRKESQKTRAEEITGIREGDSHDASVVYLPSALARADHSLKRKLGSKQVDIPMEMRLANLSLAQTGKGQAPETKNMAQLLVQALHSKDSKLLQTVFACTEPEVAHNTVNRLPLQYLPGLLEHLTTMLAGKTNQCKSCCVWTAALCQVRSAALLQQQGLAPVLAAAEARAPSLPRLLALRSRLSLLAASKTPAEEHPVLEYRDSSSEDEADDDMEEALLNGGDANDDSGSWNELEDEDEGLSSDQMSQ